MPPATWLLRLLLSLPLLLSVFVAASTADGSGGSGLRLRARVGRVFIRRPPSPPPPRTEVPSPLPAWLYFNSSLGVVEGVPLAGDVGVHLVPALGATVEVLDGPAAGNATGGCSWRHPTMAAVLVDADPRQLGPAGLCRLLRDLSLRLRVRIASLEVSPDRTAVSGGQAARPPLYMLASGPGSANVRRTAGALVTWQVGCGSIDARHLLALERLERLAMTGELTGWPVLLWYVADRLDSPAYWRPGDSPAAGIRLRRDIAGNLLLAGRVGAADAEGSGAFLPPQYAGGVGLSGGGGAAGTTASTPSWAGSTIPVRTIELPSAPTTDPASLTSSTAPPTTTTPGLPLRAPIRSSAAGSTCSRWTRSPGAGAEGHRAGAGYRSRPGGAGELRAELRHVEQPVRLWPLRPAKLQLVGRPTRRHIGVALSCRLVVEDRAGRQDLHRLQRARARAAATGAAAAAADFQLQPGPAVQRDASEQNLTVCVSLVPDDCSKDFAVNSSVQFNRTSGSLYGLVWQRDDSVGPIISMEVFVVGISKSPAPAAPPAGHSAGTSAQPRLFRTLGYTVYYAADSTIHRAAPMSITLQLAKDRADCTCPRPPKRPQARILGHLLRCQPTDLTVTPLDTCTSRPDYSFMRTRYLFQQLQTPHRLAPKPADGRPDGALQPTPHPAPSGSPRDNYTAHSNAAYARGGCARSRESTISHCVTSMCFENSRVPCPAPACLRSGVFTLWKLGGLCDSRASFVDDVAMRIALWCSLTDVNSSQSVDGEVELLVRYASWTPFRHHQVRHHHQRPTSSLTRRTAAACTNISGGLYEWLSACHVRESIYLQLRAWDFMHLRDSQPAM
uniref:A_DG1_N2 domain-containing protein n=1 Tax=Macrostomum lignano TaxID=282301 RepID=A0A1I8FHK8_9PLAT